MPKFSTKRIVAHSAENMFALVADIEKYPDFLPMCKDLKLLNRIEDGNVSVLTASMSVGYKIFCESFISTVRLDLDDKVINVAYTDGPFKYLENRWKFTDLAPFKSEVDFFIDYEFKSKTLGLLMGSVFDMAFSKFAESFEARADKLFAKK